MAYLCYKLKELPDLTLNKYASLEGRGVDGVLEKHIAFLRLLNRKGIVSDVSFHLFYLYYVPEDKAKDTPGHRLHIFLMINGSPHKDGCTKRALLEISNALNKEGIETEIIAASVRNTVHVTQCALAGADIATVPYAVIEQMTKHPLTDQGIEKFKADYIKVFGE